MDRLGRQAMYHPKKPGEPGMQRREERWAVLYDREDCCFWGCRELADTADYAEGGNSAPGIHLKQ